MKYLSFILVAIAGICYGTMATIQYHYSISIFPQGSSFWDATQSWINKYSDVTILARKEWFDFIPVPVMFTDGFHMIQSLFLTFLFVAMVCYKKITNWYLLDFFILRLVFGMFFVLFYNYILLK